MKKEEEAKEKELREQRRKEEEEFFQGIMDRYGPRIEEAAKAVIEMHKNDAPTMFYKCHIGYDFKKVPSVLTIFLDFYFEPRDWAYANSGMTKILVQEVSREIGEMKTDPELFLLVNAKKSSE